MPNRSLLSEDGTPGENGTHAWGLWLRAPERTNTPEVF